MKESSKENKENNNQNEEIFELSEEDLERISGGRLNYDQLFSEINEVEKTKKALKKFKPKYGGK